MILALLLAVAPPPPSQAYVQIKNQGTSQGYARTINCSGAGVTCAVNTTTAEATLTVSGAGGGSGGGNWDGGPAIPACSSGYVLDADGGVLYCINVIATATALAANPSDCAANTYATTIDASGNLTCSTVSDTGLANAYSGVGACSASHWASTLTRNSAPTCTQPNYTDLAGCEPGQGVAGAIQYNSSSCEGGISNAISEGTHIIYLGETMPSAPTTGSLEFDLASLPFSAPMRRDAFMGLPVPQGFYRTQTFTQIGTAANWKACVGYPLQWNSISMDGADGCSAASNIGEGTGVSGGGWGTSFTNRMRRVGFTTSTAKTWVGVHRGASADGEWVGDSAGLGGFVMWGRFWGVTHETGDATFVGVSATVTFPSGSKPSQQLNAAYVGCDSGDTNLQACSNDGSATGCTDLGSSFPCRTNATSFDVWIAMPPNALLPDAGTGWTYYVERLDSPATASGTISVHIPTNNIQLTPHVNMSSPDGGSLTTKIEVGGFGAWANW